MNVLYFFLAVIDYFLIAGIVIFTLVFSVPFMVLKSMFSFTQREEAIKVIPNAAFYNLIQTWINNHGDKIKQLDETEDEKGNPSIIIIPKNPRSASITFDIGSKVNLKVMISKYIMSFDQKDPDEEDIDLEILQKLLTAYTLGKYYVKEWYLNDILIEGKLYFELNDGTVISSTTDGTNILRLKFAKEKTINFQPLRFSA